MGVLAQPGQTFLLVGDLGAGKTCLTQGVARGLGAKEHARSPTFVLVSQYQGRLTLYHIDLYRLETTDQVLDLGLDEYLYGDGVCVVEWADKAPDVFPEDHLEVRIERIGENSRRLTLTARSKGYAEILKAVASDKAGG